MQNAGEEARPPADQCGGAGKECVNERNGRLPRSFPTTENCLGPPQPFHFRSCYQAVGALGRGWHTLTGTCPLLHTPAGHPSGAHGHPESAHILRRCTHMYHARCTAACACKYPHSRARVYRRAPLGLCAARATKLERTHTGLGALRVSITEPQRPLVLLSRLATNAPTPAFSLSLSP